LGDGIFGRTEKWEEFHPFRAQGICDIHEEQM
jgi:hypothetical protein